MSLTRKIEIALGAFVLASAAASAAGATNLGTALGVGQLVFAATAVFLLLRA